MIYINKSTIDNYFIECEDHSVCNEFMSIDDIVFESRSVCNEFMSIDDIVFESLVLNGMEIKIKYNYFSIDKENTNIMVALITDTENHSFVIPVDSYRKVLIYVNDMKLNIIYAA